MNCLHRTEKEKYTKNAKDATGKLLQLINEYGKVAG